MDKRQLRHILKRIKNNPTAVFDFMVKINFENCELKYRLRMIEKVIEKCAYCNEQYFKKVK